MGREEVETLLGTPVRYRPEKKGRGGILAYNGVQVFTAGGSVDHLTVRVGEFGDPLVYRDFCRSAASHRLAFERIDLLSDAETDYFAGCGIHVVVRDGIVDFISLCDPGWAV